MRKLELADSEIMRIAIQQEIVRSDESRYDHRLHGLLLVTGDGAAGVCQIAIGFSEPALGQRPSIVHREVCLHSAQSR